LTSYKKAQGSAISHQIGMKFLQDCASNHTFKMAAMTSQVPPSWRKRGSVHQHVQASP